MTERKSELIRSVTLVEQKYGLTIQYWLRPGGHCHSVSEASKKRV